MHRRNFLKLLGTSAFAVPAAPLMGKSRLAQLLDFGNWTGYRLTYQVSLPEGGKTARLWLPLPDTSDSAFQITQGSNWEGNASKASFAQLGSGPFPVFTAEWHERQQRHVTVSCIVKTAHHAVDLEYYAVSGQPALPNAVKHYLNASRLKPTNGIVRETAQTIIKEANAVTPLAQARAIYDWVVDHCEYDENVRGRGNGDIQTMLQKKELAGKCVDINSLFVGLARAVNIPARNQYGLRINDSKLYKSIGHYGDVTQQQHCRAEFFLVGYGWVPVNPADVRQVSKLENLPMNEPKMVRLREKFFGGWEMNWLTFNHAEDLQFPAHSHRLPFFMYPHAEIDGVMLDSLDPGQFSYRITSGEMIGTGARF